MKVVLCLIGMEAVLTVRTYSIHTYTQSSDPYSVWSDPPDRPAIFYKASDTPDRKPIFYKASDTPDRRLIFYRASDPPDMRAILCRLRQPQLI